ncbi:MAG: EMC3/TMCO1 family protein [Hadesarchaea archaeon]|nr:EMC3/TMCO1 family protein [Hadesarchaea archaeon]
MKGVIVLSLTVGLLLLSASSTVTFAKATAAGNQERLRYLLSDIDSSIIALRKGDEKGAKSSLQEALAKYLELKGPSENTFENNVELVELDNLIKQMFDSLTTTPVEDNIRALRINVVSLAGGLGISLPFIYERAMLLVLLLAAVVSLLITLITKKIVNWEKVRQIKAEVDAWRKEFLDAQRKKDLKRLHKLQQDQKRIYELQGQMMTETFKPTIIYIVPYFIFWYWLNSFYRGWVMAWLPFSLPLPFYGLWVSCGFLSWFFISYFGFSSIWRKLLIGD